MKNTIGFKRHLRPERQNKKRATFGSTFRPFQSVELSLLRLLLSRAAVRFTQLNKNKLTTDTVRYTLPEIATMMKFVRQARKVLRYAIAFVRHTTHLICQVGDVVAKVVKFVRQDTDVLRHSIYFV